MEELHRPNDSKAVVGASGGEAEHIPVNPHDNSELPMIVWLKGDEPYVEEFSMDADAAMQALGIKRSRLTQISGRELRVGRIRIDRYTRPVYRPTDIELYKQWTRPTATHLKSSSIITDAAKKLEEHTEQITNELKASVTKEVTELNELITAIRQENQTHYADYMQRTQELCDELKVKFFEGASRSSDELKLRVDALTSQIEKVEIRLQEMTAMEVKQSELRQGQLEQDKQLDIVTQALAQLTEYLGGFIEQQNSTNRDVGKALGLLIQFVRDSSRKQDQLLAALEKGPAQVTAKPAAQVPRTLRGRRFTHMMRQINKR